MPGPGALGGGSGDGRCPAAGDVSGELPPLRGIRRVHSQQAGQGLDALAGAQRRVAAQFPRDHRHVRSAAGQCPQGRARTAGQGGRPGLRAPPNLPLSRQEGSAPWRSRVRTSRTGSGEIPAAAATCRSDAPGLGHQASDGSIPDAGGQLADLPVTGI